MSGRSNVPSLQELCEELVGSLLDHENVVVILRYSRRIYCRQLEKKAFRFTLLHFVDIVQHNKDFQNLPADELIALLEEDELHLRSEDDAFKAVLQWVGFEPETRGADLFHLLKTVRLGLVSKDLLKDSLLHDALLADNTAAKDLVKKGLALSRKRERWGPDLMARRALTNPLLRPRLTANVIFVVGGDSGSWSSGGMETYDDRVQRWFKNGPKPYEDPDKWLVVTAHQAMVALDDCLYLMGGVLLDEYDYYDQYEDYDEYEYYDEYTDYNDHKWIVGYVSSSLALKFHPTKRTWQTLASMHDPRAFVCAAPVEGLIYACGGTERGTIHQTVERYAPASDQWDFVASMLTCRTEAGACGLNGTDIMFVGMYCPPEWSRYENRDVFTEVEESLMALNTGYTCLLGDLNARTAERLELLNEKSFILDFELDGNKQIDRPTRMSQDTCINNWRHKLIELCTNLNLAIANGRVGSGKNIGKFTCKNASVVDYFVLSVEHFNQIGHFDVLDFNEICTDIHCPVILHLKRSH